MTVLWESVVSGTTYSVRKAGHSVRLYSNGVFHSQWNPTRPFAGAVWDCLSLPSLYLPPNVCQRILLLGLGGGAGVRQLELLVNFNSLTAVEIDAVHIDIAQQWFGVTSENIELIHADAIQWLSNYKGVPFDLIIDDLFGHDANEPIRAQPLNAEWVKHLTSALTPHGAIIANSIGRAQISSAAREFYAQGFVQAYRWSLPEYENAIGVFLRQETSSHAWSQHLEQTGLSGQMKRAARWVIRRPIANPLA